MRTGLIKGTEAHRTIKLNERTIIKMVGCKNHCLSEGNEPWPFYWATKEDSPNQDYCRRVTELNHWQWLSGVPVKPPYSAYFELATPIRIPIVNIESQIAD